MRQCIDRRLRDALKKKQNEKEKYRLCDKNRLF